jgi:tRNA-splicing ligase RtcB
LPGTNRTSSYLCAPGEDIASSLHSVCHGAGAIIKQFAARGLSGADPRDRVTLRFDYSGAGPVEVEQLDDRGIDEALGILTANRLVRPIVRLRPFAVLN